jgi:chemotaxis protein histidine kinase CheA
MDSWDATFLELRARFTVRAGEWLEELVGVVDGLERNPDDAGALGRLGALFHRIAGSAGTYGFARVSELADEGEHAWAALGKAGATPGAEHFAAWRRLAEEIRRELSTNSH